MKMSQVKMSESAEVTIKFMTLGGLSETDPKKKKINKKQKRSVQKLNDLCNFHVATNGSTYVRGRQ